VSVAFDVPPSTPGLEAILRRATANVTPRGARTDATVVFDAGGDLAWTLRLRRGRSSLTHGRSWRATTIIAADPSTLGAVLGGSTSGVEAYLEGKLRARGNLALALELDALFVHPPRAPGIPRSHRTEVDGIETFWVEAGPSDAAPTRTPVILMHGLGATCSSMLPTLHALCRDRRVIALDLPGFGASRKPLRRYHPAFFARWLVAFLDSIGVARADLVGNSMGGRVALEVGLRFPARARKLALFAPSLAFRRFRQVVPFAKLLAPELGALPLPLPRSQVVLTMRALLANADRVPRPWFEAAADEFLRVFAEPRARIALLSAAKEIYVEDARGERGFWDRLPRLRVPSLFLFGDRDLLVPRGFAAHVRDALPHAEVQVMHDCGHAPQFELPADTHRRVRAFFDR
jgi:pimeloyl-ACP methyl ester carboxylesterase